MGKQRQQYSGEFKAKGVLEVLKGQRTVNEIASRFGVHPVQVSSGRSRRSKNWRGCSLSAAARRGGPRPPGRLARPPCRELRACTERRKGGCSLTSGAAEPCWIHKNCCNPGDCYACEVYRAACRCENLKSFVLPSRV